MRTLKRECIRENQTEAHIENYDWTENILKGLKSRLDEIEKGPSVNLKDGLKKFTQAEQYRWKKKEFKQKWIYIV